MATVLERYLRDMSGIRASGAAADEVSFYPALTTLLVEVGRKLKPKVFCISQLKDAGVRALPQWAENDRTHRSRPGCFARTTRSPALEKLGFGRSFLLLLDPRYSRNFVLFVQYEIPICARFSFLVCLRESCISPLENVASDQPFVFF